MTDEPDKIDDDELIPDLPDDIEPDGDAAPEGSSRQPPPIPDEPDWPRQSDAIDEWAPVNDEPEQGEPSVPLPDDEPEQARSNDVLPDDEPIPPLPGAGVQVDNPDGTSSSERTISVNLEGKERVIPTLIGGEQFSTDEAIESAYKHGLDNFPSFDTVEEADAYASARSDALGRQPPLEFNEATEPSGLFDDLPQDEQPPHLTFDDLPTPDITIDQPADVIPEPREPDPVAMPGFGVEPDQPHGSEQPPDLTLPIDPKDGVTFRPEPRDMSRQPDTRQVPEGQLSSPLYAGDGSEMRTGDTGTTARRDRDIPLPPDGMEAQRGMDAAPGGGDAAEGDKELTQAVTQMADMMAQILDLMGEMNTKLESIAAALSENDNAAVFG